MNNPTEDRCERFTAALTSYSAVANDVERITTGGEFLRRVALYISSAFPPLNQGQTIIGRGWDPRLADSSITNCSVLDELVGQLDARRINRPIWISRSGERPMEEKFRTVTAFKNWAGKPRDSGMFTSSAGQTDLGMWHVYGLTQSEFFEPPFRGWQLSPLPTFRLLNIANALEWCEAVTQFPKLTEATGGSIEMDWAAISRCYDAVNLSFRVVAAIDGIEFIYQGQTIAASFWSVQTTVWLRWVFSAASEVPLGLVEGPGSIARNTGPSL